MANATMRVGRATRSRVSENKVHSYGTTAAAVQLYAGAMLGLNAGYLAKFDDTASLKFFGLVLEKDGNPKLPIGTAGDGTLDVDVKQPQAFELAIAGVAITDIGRRVYALDDQTGTLDPSATVNANLIGTVVDLVYAMLPGTPVAGFALVEPIYSIPGGSQLQVLGASGAVVIKPGVVLIGKAGVAALTLADPTAGVHDGLVMRFQSVTASAHTLDNSAGSGFNAGGGASDVGTFGGAKGDGMEITAYAGKWYANWLRNVTLG